MAQTQMLFQNQFQTDNQQATDQKLSFSHSFRPTYLVSRAFGLMPFSIVYFPNGDIDRPKVSIIDGLWFAFSLCIYIFGIYVASSIPILNQGILKIALVLLIGYTICFELGLILGLLSVTLDMSNRFKIVDIMRKFTFFDQEAS